MEFIILFAIIAGVLVGIYNSISNARRRNARLKKQKHKKIPPLRGNSTPQQHRQYEMLDFERISIESADIASSTKDVSVFLSRYQLMLDRSTDFINLGYSDATDFRQNAVSLFGKRLIDCVDRCLADVQLLKTPKGRFNRMCKLADAVSSYPMGDKSCQSLVEKQLERIQEKINNEYIQFLSIDTVKCPVESCTHTDVGTRCPQSKQEPQHALTTPQTIFNNINIPPQIQSLLWISSGEFKNYTPTYESTQYDGFGIQFATNNSLEPSAIDVNLDIDISLGTDAIEKLGYYPSYASCTPTQRWRYLKYLENPLADINDIGYVFMFYYGLERHLFFGEYKLAFNCILDLVRTRNNPSLAYYAFYSLITAALINNDDNGLLQLFAIDFFKKGIDLNGVLLIYNIQINI